MPHLVHDQAPNGVERLLRVQAAQGDIERSVDPLDGRVAADPVTAVGQTVDVAFVVCHIKLVFDFAHDLLQHIFNADEAGHPAKLVDHDGEVAVVALKIAQEVVQPFGLRHKDSRTQERPNVQLGRALELEQVFGQQDANDVFALAFKYRKSGVGGVNDALHQRIVRVPDVDQLHAGGRHHGVPCGHVGHADHSFEHGAGLGVDDLVVFGFNQGFNQLGG